MKLKPQPIDVTLEIPRKFDFLFELHPYKVAHGGRYGLKSWSFAKAILALGSVQTLRVACGRQVMKSIDDSVHTLFTDLIKNEGFGPFYTILDQEIRGINGTTISYTGLSNQTATSIKSFEGVDVFWVEEAQDVTDFVWNILMPTIRGNNSELWVTFNPGMIDDATYKLWVLNPPPGAVVVKVTYEYAKELGLFTDKMEALRLHHQATLPKDEYENIWDGKPRLAVSGAIFAHEVVAAIEEGRVSKQPYNPMFPVHTVWDLGWNDAMAIIMVQKTSPSSLTIINYIEDSFHSYAEYVEDMNKLRYLWGTDWLPHDGANKDPKTKMSAKQILEKLGRASVKLVSTTPPNVEESIKAARMMFPRVYFDNTERTRPSGHFGVPRLLTCLKRYARSVPEKTGEPGAPIKNEYKHGADAFRYFAMVAERITNEGGRTYPLLPGFQQHDPEMGLLG